MVQLNGKVAVITGASSGIGKETAIHFASLNCRVTITGRNADNLSETKAKCIANGLKEADVLAIVGDVTDEEFCKKLISETANYFGKIDILVNNAGIFLKKTIEDTSLDAFDIMMKMNVRSVFVLTQLVIPHLRHSKGCIVNVSSCCGLRAFATLSAYCMSKAAIDQLTRSAALEFATDGIRVNSVNPAVIQTNIHKTGGGMNDEEYAKFIEYMNGIHPLGRTGTPIEVAKSIAFLASDDASFITGVTLPIDGGRSQLCPR